MNELYAFLNTISVLVIASTLTSIGTYIVNRQLDKKKENRFLRQIIDKVIQYRLFLIESIKGKNNNTELISIEKEIYTFILNSEELTNPNKTQFIPKSKLGKQKKLFQIIQPLIMLELHYEVKNKLSISKITKKETPIFTSFTSFRHLFFFILETVKREKNREMKKLITDLEKLEIEINGEKGTIQKLSEKEIF